MSRSLDRLAFDCRVASLNEWLQQRATQWSRRDLARVYCALPLSGDQLVGFYSLSNHIVERDQLPEDARSGSPHNLPVPSALIGQLAVDRTCHGRGLGSALLVDALRRVVRLSDEIGIRVVQVHAINIEAVGFYKNHGFTSMVDNEHHLFLAVKEARKLTT